MIARRDKNTDIIIPYYCCSPVNDAFSVEEFEGQEDFRGIESGPFSLESTRLLNVEHQISAVQIFHHEK